MGSFNLSPVDAARLGSVVPDSLVLLSADGDILDWNEGARQLYGFSVDEARGRRIDDLLGTRHPFGLLHIADALNTAGQWQGEFFRVASDGNDIGVKARIGIQPGGARLEWTRAISEASTKEIAAHRYTNLFHAMAASFWELDFSSVRRALGDLLEQGVADLPRYLLENRDFIDRAIPLVRVLDVNEKTVELFEIGDRETAVVEPMDWAWPPESRHVFAESLIAALRRDERYTTETTLRTKQGKPIDVLFTVCWPGDHKGQGSVLVGVIDISETKRAFRDLQESEQHYRDLFQNMPVALLRLDLTGLNSSLADLRESGIEDLAAHIENTPELISEILHLPQIVDANAEALRLFGADDPDRLKGPIAWGWLERPDTIGRSLAARLRGLSHFSEETRINRLDGSPIDVIYAISFAHGQVEKERNVIGFLDITDRKLAEADLRLAREELSHAARISMLGELTASIAHEVNQPLAAISALAGASLRWLGRETPDLEEVRTLTADIASDARRASEIISRIRALAAKRAAQHEPVDLNALVRESLLVLKHDSEARGVEMRFQADTALAPITGDRIQLQQVIVNLVVNALQAISSREDRERRVIVRTSDEGASAAIHVLDTGPGIAPENIERLFDSFFTTKGSGMGLGLSVCKSIVEAHGGGIRAENYSEGARFIVSLPRI